MRITIRSAVPILGSDSMGADLFVSHFLSEFRSLKYPSYSSIRSIGDADFHLILMVERFNVFVLLRSKDSSSQQA